MPLPALAAAVLPYVPVLASVAFSGISAYFRGKASYEKTEADIKTEERRKKIAEENAHLADLESYEQASKARKEQLYLSSQMELRMSKAGLSPMTQELWMGQTLAEMEHERQTILGSGQKKSKRYMDESDWLQGNIESLHKDQDWGVTGHIMGFRAEVAGIANQKIKWNIEQNKQGGL